MSIKRKRGDFLGQPYSTDKPLKRQSLQNSFVLSSAENYKNLWSCVWCLLVFLSLFHLVSCILLL